MARHTSDFERIVNQLMNKKPMLEDELQASFK